MGNVPVLKPREVASILKKLGFKMVRQRGSHRQYRHPDGRCTTIPFHQGKRYLSYFIAQNYQRHRYDGRNVSKFGAKKINFWPGKSLHLTADIATYPRSQPLTINSY